MTETKTASEIAVKLDSLAIDYDALAWFAYEWMESYGTECPKELQHLSTCLAMFSDKLHSLSKSAYEVARAS